MEPENDIIIYCLKMFVINILVYYCFIKIANIKKAKGIVIMLITNFILMGVSAYLELFVNFPLAEIIVYLLYSIIIGVILKVKIGYSLITGIISYAVCLICFGASTMLSFIPYKLIYTIFNVENPFFNLMIMLIMQIGLVYGFFKIRRFKNGFDFLRNKFNNDFADVIVANVGVIVILIYCLIGNYNENYDREVASNLVITFIIITIAMIITIQKVFMMYYKQNLMKRIIGDYERELKEKDDEIARLNKERFNISKITHEFYNRQKALELAVKRLTEVGKINVETAEELSALDKINNLTDEYTSKLKAMQSLPTLPLTEIPEIDDMFKYMQSECSKNNIEFKLKIAGNIFHLINNIIPKNKLETMIGDHIRDAIIAVNANNTENKEIFVILGIKDNKYELCIYDTGIEFEIETLLKLGLEPVTTHKETGGTGIGFLTTFETLKETKASLIIREESPVKENQFTKAVIIRFDNKSQYKICSYRANQIKKQNKNRKILIEKLDNKKGSR